MQFITFYEQNNEETWAEIINDHVNRRFYSWFMVKSPESHLAWSMSFTRNAELCRISGDLTKNSGQYFSGFGRYNFGWDDFWATSPHTLQSNLRRKWLIPWQEFFKYKSSKSVNCNFYRTCMPKVSTLLLPLAVSQHSHFSAVNMLWNNWLCINANILRGFITETKNQFPLDFLHTSTVILPSVNRALNDSNHLLTWGNFVSSQVISI